MLPVIALIGRPNVGKSTLFNRLTKSRDAIVADMPGLTRDRQYGEGKVGDTQYLVIDTGGLGEEEHQIDPLMVAQSQQAIDEADSLIFLVDGRTGLTAADEMLAKQLRSLSKPVTLVVNKCDGVDEAVACADFHALGLSPPIPIAAAHGRGIKGLMGIVLAGVQKPSSIAVEEPPKNGITLAIVGRPNTGKSTLVNTMLGEERVVVFDMPGTTRDSIYIPLERQGKQYTLIDTAGVRRRGKVKQTVEKFSVVKTLQAIEDAHVVIMLFDGQEGPTDQDLHLLGFIVDAGRAVVLAVNKWDGLSPSQRQKVRATIERKLSFADFARMHFISALHGSGVGNLFASVEEAYQSAMMPLSTSTLTEILQQAVQQHQPPLVKGRRIKLRYAHPGGHNPPIIVIHGNQTENLPLSYQRYLIHTYRKSLKLLGTPIRLHLKRGHNPYV